MRHSLLTLLVLAGLTACSGETASEPTALDTESLIASASAWTPEDITRDLDVDAATRQQIEDGIRSLHTAMLDLHARHEQAASLDGDARAAAMAAVHDAAAALHERHTELWNSLDADVRDALAKRFHEHMEAADDEGAKSLHERMRRLHGGDHAGSSAGH